jgi:hypothetical protein
LNLVAGVAMNTKINNKMDMRIYTGSGHWSVISYVQCELVSTLLISMSSIEELITGEGLQAREYL